MHVRFKWEVSIIYADCCQSQLLRHLQQYNLIRLITIYLGYINLWWLGCFYENFLQCDDPKYLSIFSFIFMDIVKLQYLTIQIKACSIINTMMGVEYQILFRFNYISLVISKNLFFF